MACRPKSHYSRTVLFRRVDTLQLYDLTKAPSASLLGLLMVIQILGYVPLSPQVIEGMSTTTDLHSREDLGHRNKQQGRFAESEVLL
ncbi:hypothetical protein LTR17_019079, partial [Elasticomyces elasticus]